MPLFRKQVSAALAMVMLFTSVISTVLVICTSGSDHHAVELIGHQVGVADHSADTFYLAAHQSAHEAHPATCADTSLLADALTQRENLSAGWENISPQLWLAYPLDDQLAASVAFDSSHWPVYPHAPPTWSAIDDLSTIRLLI